MCELKGKSVHHSLAGDTHLQFAFAALFLARFWTFTHGSKTNGLTVVGCSRDVAQKNTGQPAGKLEDNDELGWVWATRRPEQRI